MKYIRLIVLLHRKIKIRLATSKISHAQCNTEIDEKENVAKINEKKVSLQIAIEKKKSNSDWTLNEEYTDKVLLYGYISVYMQFFFIYKMIRILNLFDWYVCIYNKDICVFFFTWTVIIIYNKHN